MGHTRDTQAHGGLSTGGTGAGERRGTSGDTASTSVGRRGARQLAQSPEPLGVRPWALGATTVSALSFIAIASGSSLNLQIFFSVLVVGIGGERAGVGVHA
mgnify:CR=1 FL=1